MTEIKTYTNKEERAEMLKFYQTVPTDREGNVLETSYNSMEVRNDIIKLLVDFNSLITTIESLQQKMNIRDKLITAQVEHIDTVNKHMESLQQENEQLKRRDFVVSMTNETLGRYVREGKEEIKRLKSLFIQEGKSREFTVEESKMHSEMLNENSVVVKNIYYQEGEK